jgi:hypothetical protein
MTLNDIAVRLETAGQHGIAAELRSIIPLYVQSVPPETKELVGPPTSFVESPPEPPPGSLERFTKALKVKPHGR